MYSYYFTGKEKNLMYEQMKKSILSRAKAYEFNMFFLQYDQRIVKNGELTGDGL